MIPFKFYRWYTTYPTPTFLKRSWGFGSALGILFLVQSLIGIFLAALYAPSSEAFSIVGCAITNIGGSRCCCQHRRLNMTSRFFIIMSSYFYKVINYDSWLTRWEVWTPSALSLLLTASVSACLLGRALPRGPAGYWAGYSLVKTIKEC